MTDDPEEPRRGLSPAQLWHYYQRYPYLLAKVGLWGLVVVALWWAMTNVQSVLFPVLVSILIAYLLDPPVDWLEAQCDRISLFERMEISRTMAIGVFLLVILAALVAFALVLYPALAKQVSKVVQRFPELVVLVQDNLIPWVERTFDYKLPSNVSEAMETYGDTVKEQLPNILDQVSTWAGTVLTQSGAVAASILNLVMIPLFTFYFLRDFDRMTGALRHFVPTHHREFYLERIHKMDEVVGAWFRGQVTVALILAVMYGAGLGVVFGLVGIGAWTGIAIGILSGILNIIPYFGFLIGFILSILMVLLDWGGFGPVIAVVAVFTVVQLLESYLITPKIVGESVGLSPVTVIIVLLLGGELFGLLGVLLAIPVAGIIRVLLPDFVGYYKKTPFYSGDYATDDAVARAMSAPRRRRSDVTPDTTTDPGGEPPGLTEPTDGSLDVVDVAPDEDELETQAPSRASKASLKRPITQTDAKASERVDEAPSALDVGTDGDVEEDRDSDVDDATPDADPEPDVRASEEE